MSLRTKQFLLTSAATMAITIALATPSSARANDANEVIGQPVVGRLATAAPSGQKAPAFLGTDNDAPAAEATAAAETTSETTVETTAASMASELADAQMQRLKGRLTDQIATLPPVAEAAATVGEPVADKASDAATDDAEEVVEIFSGDIPVREKTVILPPVPMSKPVTGSFHQSERNDDMPLTESVLASSADMVQVADASQVAQAVTGDMAAVILKAIENHPQVLGRRASLEASNEAVKIERSDLFPTLSAEGFTGYRNTDNRTTRARPTRGANGDGDVSAWASEGTLRLRQLLFDFGKSPNEIDAAKSRLSESQFVEADSEEQIGLRAVEAYLSVQQSKMNTELAERNVDAHLTTLDNVSRRADAGAGDTGDVTQTESRLALAREILLGFEEALDIAQADFKEAVGEMPGMLSPAKVPAIPVPDRVDEAIEIAKTENPFIVAAGHAAEGFGHDADAAFGDFYPRFDFDLSYTRGDDVSGIGGRDEETRALVRMVWDIPVAGGEIANRKRLLRLQEAAELEQEERVRLIEEAVRTSYAQVKRTETQIEQLRLRADSADGVVEAYQKQFGAGRRTLLDLLDSENERFLARVALNNGEIDLIRANYQLFTAMGRLRQVLGLPAKLVEPKDD